EERDTARRRALRGDRPPAGARVRARSERRRHRARRRGAGKRGRPRLADQGDVRRPGGRRIVAMDFEKLMQQAQQMQDQKAKAKAELADEVVEASAGGGMVRVKATGALEITEIKISPEAIDPDDLQMLADMVLAAVNEALRSAQKLVESKLGSAMGGMQGLGLPGL